MNQQMKTNSTLLLPGSVGELFDKLTILRIKNQRIHDPLKLKNVRREMLLLEQIATTLVLPPEVEPVIAQLQAVNEQLWSIEDEIRECERARDFSQNFISLARAVYITNDQRATLKRQLNELAGSDVIEEKSYADYQ